MGFVSQEKVFQIIAIGKICSHLASYLSVGSSRIDSFKVITPVTSSMRKNLELDWSGLSEKRVTLCGAIRSLSRAVTVTIGSPRGTICNVPTVQN